MKIAALALILAVFGIEAVHAQGMAAKPFLRSMTVTLRSDGTAIADWTNNGGALPSPAIVTLTPISASPGAVPKCWLTGIPTTLQAPIKCVVEKSDATTGALSLTSAIIAAGVNINGGIAAGMQVQVTALPSF